MHRWLYQEPDCSIPCLNWYWLFPPTPEHAPCLIFNKSGVRIWMRHVQTVTYFQCPLLAGQQI